MEPTQTEAGQTSSGQLMDDYIAVLISGIANRLNRGASNHYRTQWGIGIQEWRVMLALDSDTELSVGRVADAADLDIAAASRALRSLKRQKFVVLRRTNQRGRTTFARLSIAGSRLQKRLVAVAREREERLVSVLQPGEVAELRRLLVVLLDGISVMNAENSDPTQHDHAERLAASPSHLNSGA